MKIIAIMASLFISIGVNAQTVSNFQLKDVDNNLRSLDELKGAKLTVIDFWATWCKPCMKAMPVLNHLYEKYKDQGLNVIGISCDGPRSISKVGPLVKSLQLNYPVLIDIDAEVMNDLNLQAYPTLILVNSESKIIWVHEGFVSGDDEIIATEIEKQLSTANP